MKGNNTSTRRKPKNKKSKINNGNIRKPKLKKQQSKLKAGTSIVKKTISNTANSVSLTDIYTKKEGNKQQINKLKVKKKSKNIGVQQSQNPNNLSSKSDKNKKKNSENIGLQQKQNTLRLSPKKVKNKKNQFENIGVQQRQNTHYLSSKNDKNKKEKEEKYKIAHQKHKERSKQSRNEVGSFSPSTRKTNDETEKGNFKKKRKVKESNDMLEHQMQESESHTSAIVSMQTISKAQKQMQRYSEKLQKNMKQKHSSVGLNRKQIAALPLRERMVEKLKAARFRYLNEQMYTSMGKDAEKFFHTDANAYAAYHEGYRQQVARWPLNPLNIIIEKIRKLPQSYVIADFGCGEASLAQSVPHTVHSFDLVAVNEHVTACDMAHVLLENNSVNVVVFCLSLMGTNLKDYLLEANRVLKSNGLLMIAEVESRFEKVDTFIKNVQSFGFVKTRKDLSHDLFCFLDFVKKDLKLKQKNKLPDVSLNPCLYKRR